MATHTNFIVTGNEVLMAMVASVLVFWDVSLLVLENCARVSEEPLVFIFREEDGSRCFLQNVVKHH
jgi:hypothetical protein